jgi:RNA polymerase sigma-70 factor (ECF subfamily)
MRESELHREFPVTCWSLILQAASVPSAATREALEKLCQEYWPPLYAYLRRAGHDPHEAKDLVQGYLARLIAREDLEAVGPGKGRFRSYLLAGLRNFLISEVRRENAQKRGGGTDVVSIDAEEAESGCGVVLARELTPDQAFDRRWAETILFHAIEALRQEYLARGNRELFEALKPSLTGGAAEDRAALGRALGMTPGAVAVAVHRLRLRLRELVRLEVAQTVESSTMIDEEMRELLAILSGSGRA